jgi:hypothetical protein
VHRQDFRALVRGIDYHPFLRSLHERLKPQSYLEIGVRWGGTFRLAKCASIGIDPKFALLRPFVKTKPMCLLYQETSDYFFEHRDPKVLFGRPIDMAFLDGMHHFEFLLRDFINTERHSHTNSVILLHDCLPPHVSMTTREQSKALYNRLPYTFWWTGDVWKIIPVLRKYRPDLSVELFDCSPTGLVAITGLDPTSRVLSEAYQEIIAWHEARKNDSEELAEYWDSIQVSPSRSLTPQQLTIRYGLQRPAAATL